MCYDLIVVGAGPAGMTAALYAASELAKRPSQRESVRAAA